MSIYQVTIKFNLDNATQEIREFPSPDIEVAFKHFEEQARQEWGNLKIETITVESMPENVLAHSM